MRFCHVAHGNMPIPPAGHGAVEQLIWDYKQFLESRGHEVAIVNDRDSGIVERFLARLRPDVVHAHCERHFDVVARCACPLRIVSSHWPALFEPAEAGRAARIHQGDFHICCLSPVVRVRLAESGIAPERMFVVPNAANGRAIRFSEIPSAPNRSIYLGAIQSRKRQRLAAGLDRVDFVGPRSDPEFDYAHPRYLGAWSRDEVNRRLTDYGNLVLLSSSEVAPLVVCEALLAGLGVVVSGAAAANLDPSLPFVTVVPEAAMQRAGELEEMIERNRSAALAMRRDIRGYALATFDVAAVGERYLRNVEGLAAGRSPPP